VRLILNNCTHFAFQTDLGSGRLAGWPALYNKSLIICFKKKRDFAYGVGMTLTKEQVETFVRAVGGGRGNYESDPGKTESSNPPVYFHQIDRCITPKTGYGLGFGKIRFTRAAGDLKPYIRVPWSSKKDRISTDPRLLLHFVETVWGLPRPKLLVSVTGGALNFEVSEDLDLVLSDLMNFARRTSAWLTTGGTYGGIMKLLGGCPQPTRARR
jgi:hypothetical protein